MKIKISILLTSILCMTAILLRAQSNKYALVIQNRTFDNINWPNFNRLEKNADNVKQLLENQGFDERNIIIQKDVTTQGFREAYHTLISRLKESSMCVVFIGSHGTTIKDINNDEHDKLDEAIVCRNSQVKQRNSDSDSHQVILDDEIQRFNSLILKKIGSGGQLLFLGDYCHATDSERGDGDDLSNNSLYASDFADYDDIKTEGNGKFIMFAASNSLLKVADGPTSFFVNALTLSIQSFLPQKRTYKQWFNLAQQKLPTMSISGDYDEYIWGGDVTYQLKAVSSKAKFKSSAISQRSDENIVTSIFKVDSCKQFQEGMLVSIHQNQEVISEGWITEIKFDSNELEIKWLRAFTSLPDAKYTIQSSDFFFKLVKSVNKIKKKNEIVEILNYLPKSDLTISATVCVNAYKEINKEKIVLDEPCKNLTNAQSLKNSDNLTLTLNTEKLPNSLFYTILDITPEYVNYCYENEDSNTPASFINIQESIVFQSNLLKSINSNTLLILLSDVPITGQQVAFFIGKEYNPYEKNYIWDVLKHIVAYKAINYTVTNRK